MPLRWFVVLVVAWAVLASMPSVAQACGPETDCDVAGRTYRIAVPPGEGPFGAILYLHGYGANAGGVMGFADLRAVASKLRVALIAPDSAAKGWLIRNAPRRGLTNSDIELNAIDAILDDAATRFPIDRGRVLVAGFSGGGMMAWTLACRRGADFVGLVPVAGTFWAPLPNDCENPPVNILHVHGTADTVVPLEGRAIADTRQGKVDDAVAMFRKAAGHDAPRPLELMEGLRCEGSRGANETRIITCLHDGGHAVEAQWVAAGWQLFAPH